MAEHDPPAGQPLPRLWEGSFGDARLLTPRVLMRPEQRGRGYGSGAQRAAAEYLFAHTPVARVEASTEADNVAERRALLRAGFTEEGVLRRAVFRDGSYRDMVMFSMLREELG